MIMKTRRVSFTLSLLALGICSGTALAQDDGRNIARDREPIPLTQPGSWISQQDYPADIRRAGVEGATEIELEVGVDGVPLACDVIGSSGNTRLDDRACLRLMQNARFKPARDSRGGAIVSIYPTNVVWALSETPPPSEMHVEFTIVIDEKGQVSDCETVTLEGPAADEKEPFCPDHLNFQPIVDEDGNPVARRIRTTMKVEYEDL